jgi:exodeoxyribonuclease VII small subunit
MTEKLSTFEKKLNAIDDIVKQMEQGELSLDDSLKQYEKGIQLVRTCQSLLKEAEQKVQRLKDDTLIDFNPDDKS